MPTLDELGGMMSGYGNGLSNLLRNFDYSSLLGIGGAQAADQWSANRGSDSRVNAPGYVGQSVAANQTGNGQAVAQAMNELKAMGPPQMWHPSKQAQNMARMKQLQDFIRSQQR